jgi:[acyl-carrier-protein] S-malonyltransferase
MIAFLFPGQGSQSPGMGKFLYDNFKIAKECFEEASDAINLDLKKLCFEGSIEELSLTENTQPALLCVSVSTALVLKNDFGILPSVTAGHSIGEYSAVVFGESISFSNAVKAVRLRGQAMQSAVPVGLGGMTATLGLTDEQVEFLCKWAIENSGLGPLSPANYNSDGQIVISGNQKTLDWLKLNFKSEVLPGEAKRAKLIPLQVSAPFHCEMMLPAQKTMEVFLNRIEFSNSKVNIIQNVNAQTENNGLQIRRNLISQISSPVKWTQSMIALKKMGASSCIECGNGQVLKGLLKKIDPDFFKVFTTNSMEDLKNIEIHFKF